MKLTEIHNKTKIHNLKYQQRTREQRLFKAGIKPALLESNPRLERELNCPRVIIREAREVDIQGKKRVKPAIILYSHKELTEEERENIKTDKVGLVIGYPPMAVASMQKRKDIKKERGYTLEVSGLHFWVADKEIAKESLEWCKKEYKEQLEIKGIPIEITLKDVETGKYYSVETKEEIK